MKIMKSAPSSKAAISLLLAAFASCMVPSEGTYNYCGTTWTNANSQCGTECPLGTTEECPTGQICYADCTACPVNAGNNIGITYNHNYCGSSWGAANSQCGTSCPQGEDSECPSGQLCYADCTACPAVQVGTLSPTVSVAPTSSPRPTNPPYTSAPFASGDCSAVKNTVNFGYYQSWAIYRNSNCNPIWPGSIDVASFGYTHLAFSFAGISTSGFIEPYNGDKSQYSMYSLFNSLKDSNPGLKTLIAVGGWTFDQTRFSYVSSTSERRAAFAESVVNFLEAHKFDGIDIDWEYPVTRQGVAADYANYPLLCQALRTAFDDSGHSDWLITIATSINPDKLAQGYDMLGMVPHIDWFNMMSYDIYGAWDSKAGANGDMENIGNTFEYIFNLGVPREKLVFGMAAYGRSSTLSSTSCTTDGCPINGAGITGCPGEPGFLPYFEIIEKYVSTGNHDSLIFNPTSGSMELVTGGNRYFTSFDSPFTFEMKHKYAFDQCMRGIMWWAVDTIKEPVVSTDVFPTASPTVSPAPSISSGPSMKPTTSMPTASSAPTIEPTTTAPTNACGTGCPAGFTGMLPSSDCSQFYYCNNGAMQGGMNTCPPSTLFDASIEVCNWASTTLCACSNAGTVPEAPPSPSPPTASCGTCPPTSYAMIAAADCSGFYYCSNGVVSSIVMCPSGTIFDTSLKGCNWKSMVTCSCTTSQTQANLPTPKPTTKPPAISTGIWYPDWEKANTCVDDGQQSVWMSTVYLFSTKSACCAKHFWYDASCT